MIYRKLGKSLLNRTLSMFNNYNDLKKETTKRNKTYLSYTETLNV